MSRSGFSSYSPSSAGLSAARPMMTVAPSVTHYRSLSSPIAPNGTVLTPASPPRAYVPVSSPQQQQVLRRRYLTFDPQSGTYREITDASYSPSSSASRSISSPPVSRVVPPSPARVTTLSTSYLPASPPRQPTYAAAPSSLPAATTTTVRYAPGPALPASPPHASASTYTPLLFSGSGGVGSSSS
eukprot:RCo020490